MSENKISYLNRTFEDYREAFKKLAEKYYPEVANDLNDASIGSFFIDLIAAASDNLSYYIDKTYNETNINTAQERSSVLSIARNNGLKIQGPKGAMTELEFTCQLPVSSNYGNSSSELGEPNYFFAPIIKKGTRVCSTTNEYFEISEDVDFSKQFNENGISDREIKPLYNANNNIVAYEVTKKYVVATAGTTKIYKLILNDSMITPFMEIVLPEKDIMSIESVLVKEGMTYTADPTSLDFSMQREFASASETKNGNTYRFFEVDSLLEQYRWGEDVDVFEKGNEYTAYPEKYMYGTLINGVSVATTSIARGQWFPLTQKFISEYTDNGYLKIIFGSGEQVGQDVDITKAGSFTKNQISRMVRNNFLGKLPIGESTLYVQYRVGGGAKSNVPANSIKTITYLNVETNNCPTTKEERELVGVIKNSIKVTNTIPSVAGKDAPSIEEIKAMVKYYNGAQERCVTVKDYESRVEMLPSKYGCPFRVRGVEENNKIMLYLLNVNSQGNLSDTIPTVLIENILNYLSMYRTVNDYVEIKPGRIINLSFEVDLYVDKNYNVGNVVSTVIDNITKFMDISNHQLGEDIYVSNIEKEIILTDGVLNIIDLRIYNEYGNDYSNVMIGQEVVSQDEYNSQALVDLDASDYILNSASDEMYEIKYPNKDIRIRCISR